MKDLNDDVLEITMDDGSKKNAKILFCFKENGDEYIFYEIENDLNEQAYVGKINQNNELMPINDDEWEIVEKIYQEFINDSTNNK